MNSECRARLRRVLVVDGDRAFADNLCDILASDGCEVALAHGAAAAKRVLGGFAAEVALIDTRLGRGSGIDPIARLRRHVGTTGEGRPHDEKIDRMAFRRRSVKPKKSGLRMVAERK